MRLSIRFLCLLCAVTLYSAIPGSCRAEVFIEHLSPPVVQRGKTCRIQFFGTMLDQPVGLWTSVPSRSRKAAKAGDVWAVAPVGAGTAAGSVIDVQVPPDAPLGVYGLRLATRSGLSNVHLFLIDELPVTERTVLPVVDPQGVARTALPACVTSVCREAIIDRYAIDVKAGQRVSFEVIGNRFGKDYDPLVTIRNAQGRLLAERDNDPGLLFDCRFDYTFADAGTYLVEVRESRFQGNATWHYVLRMGDFPAGRVVIPSAVRPGQKNALTFPQLSGLRIDIDVPPDLPAGMFFQELRAASHTVATWVPVLSSSRENAVEVEPNDTRETATPVNVPANLHGVLATPGEQDWFSFKLAKGQSLHLQGEANSLGSPADLEFAVFDATGRELRRIDDVGLEEGAFDFNVGQEGQYFLMVRDVARDGGPAFAYRIEVEPGPARLQLTSDVSALTVPQKSYQPIPLTVTRTAFQGPVELSLIGAPAGVTLEPAMVPAEANEFVCRLIAADSAAVGVSTIQIVGRAKAGETALEAVVRTQPLVDRQLHNVDLIIYALREEQRHLPPSLIDRVAVQVTPPAPYTIEFPEQVVVLPRFQSVAFPAVITRVAGFDGPLSFEAKGGQIGLETEFRRQIYGRFPNALPGQTNVPLSFFTRNLTQLAKTRVDLSATGVHDGRTICLTRTFTLDVKSTFEPTIEAPQPPMPVAATPGGTPPAKPAAPGEAKATVLPGGAVKLRVHANRMPSFDGAVTIAPIRSTGFILPETVEIPKGQPSVEIEVKTAADIKPGKYRLRFPVSGFVGQFEESLNGPEVEIEVKPVPMETKKAT